jgi:hypothetical protein
VISDNNIGQSVSTPDSGAGQAVLFTTFGSRIGRDGSICKLQAFLIFRYFDTVNQIPNLSRAGYTSMYPSAVPTAAASGVTFRDKLPEFFFRWVLIHEMGQYFSLEHSGHDGMHLIMWTPAEEEGLKWWTGETTADLFLAGLEPRFTRDDAYRVWRWIITSARDCLFGQEV